MAKKQIVTINTNHICPMVTGTTPHVGGPVVGPGCPGVLIDGQPIALIGDTCICCGPPDLVAQGYSSILADGKPIVVQDCMTAHGGIIPSGIPGVTVDSATPVKPLTMHIKRIPFPEISMVDRIGAATTGHTDSLRQAEENIRELKKQAETTEPYIYNLRWEKEGNPIHTERIDENTKMVADVSGISDGETVKIKVCIDEENNTIEEMEGTVKEGKIEIGWEVLASHFQEKDK